MSKEHDPDNEERFDVNLRVDYCRYFVDSWMQEANHSKLTVELRQNFNSQSEAVDFVFEKYRSRIDDIRRDVA